MKSFMDKDFMLYNDTAKHLFHDYAENLPIVDYHCHISPKEIYEDRRYNNIAEVWLGGRNADGTYFGDHYKWRLMRKKYFGINEPLTVDNAKQIWDKTTDMLQHDPDLTVRGIIRKSNVAFIGTTDDPVDSLEWHEKLAEVKDLGFKVCPSFRPDKAVNIQRPGYVEYIAELSRAAGMEIQSAEDVCTALNRRIDFFKAHGCKASDHGLDYVPFEPCTMEEADRVFRKAMAGEALTKKEIDEYQTTVLLSLARKYHRENIVMEIHYSCSRNVNRRMFRLEGPDTGFDMIAKSLCYQQLADFFSALDENNELPKCIVFSLDQSDFNQITTCLGCFQSDEVPGKMQLGAAWWFLDTRDGMEEQMKSLARLGILGNFVGMLTDSRSFLSYTRHDYFRRIACNLIGEWVEKGEYPDNDASLKKIVEGISYKNAVRYFGI